MHKELYATRRYYKLIDFYRHKTVEGYTEGHHIVPRCMGGSDDEYNIVRLPAKAHYIAHLLLTKMYPDYRSLLSAFACMQRDPAGNADRVFRAAQYDKMKQANVKAWGTECVIDGVEFPSKKAAARHYKVDEKRIRRWLNEFDGKSQEAYAGHSNGHPCVIDGVEYSSECQAAKKLGVSRRQIRKKINMLNSDTDN